jgi:lysophospholipase L1-like esterase
MGSALRSRLTVAVLAVVATVGLTAGTAMPASAAPASAAPASARGSSVLRYVALGDSYAAGQATDCTHTSTSYPLLLDRLHRVELVRDVSCAQATTAVVVATQLPALNRQVGLVTITVGANDLDVAGLELVCAPAPASPGCAAAIATRRTELPDLFTKLVATYLRIAAAAPRATILVTGYAPLVSSGPLYDAERALNGTIGAAVAVAAATGAHIRYVDVVFRGHTVDSPHPWFVLSGPNIFHPTSRGNLAYALALAAALRCIGRD